jgi:hypothetical protein
VAVALLYRNRYASGEVVSIFPFKEQPAVLLSEKNAFVAVCHRPKEKPRDKRQPLLTKALDLTLRNFRG